MYTAAMGNKPDAFSYQRQPLVDLPADHVLQVGIDAQGTRGLVMELRDSQLPTGIQVGTCSGDGCKKGRPVQIVLASGHGKCHDKCEEADPNHDKCSICVVFAPRRSSVDPGSTIARYRGGG